MDGKRIAALLTAGALALVPGLIRVVPAAAAGSAPGAPGSNATWDESQVTGFADSLGAASKVWYTLGNGELENVFYPETDTPDTFGLQYVVTNGSSFASTETTGTSHTITLADPNALVWQQVNKATNGDFTITKTYIADPSRSVVLVQTTFDNLTSAPLQLYADYHPQLDNDGMGNTGGTDATSGDLVASNSSVSSALAASTGFSQTSTGYVGSSSDGETALTSQLQPGHHVQLGVQRRAHRSGRADSGRLGRARRRSRSRSPSTPASPPRSPTRRRRWRPGSPRWRARSSPAGTPGSAACTARPPRSPAAPPCRRSTTSRSWR